MQRPLSITLFAGLFGFSVMVALLLALYAVQPSDFSFTLTPEAADTLTIRIRAIRLFGIAFAVVLMLLVVIGRSRAARSAHGLRWVLGLVTSVAFLRGIGVILPGSGTGVEVVTLSIIQLSVEGGAILLLYGDDAAAWFEGRLSH